MSYSKNGMFFFITTLLFANIVHAVVDLKNANYASTWTDIEVPGSGYNLKVTRTYNSRTLFNGMFGFGWCSDFETSLKINPEGNILLTECGSGSEILFSSREPSKKDVEKTISQVIAKMRSEKKVGQTEEQLRLLAKQMMENDDLRMDLARKHDISVPLKEGTKFLANGREVENIVFSKGVYTRTLSDGSMQRFNPQGQLNALYDKNGNFLKFDYEKTMIVKISDNNARNLFFKYFPNKKVKEITGPFGIKVEYKFSNLDDLASATNQWKHTFTYKYDELHNLVLATWPDKTFMALKYDVKNDWVIGITDRQKCTENYKYEFDEKEAKLHYWATVKKTCGKEVVADNRYEFWYGQRADGSGYLKRILTEVADEETDISYNDTFGKPIMIRRNKDVMNFDYYADGRVKTKSNPTMKMVFEYENPLRKPSQVKTDYFNDKGKKTGTRLTQFKYDEKGNLIFAQNSDGQIVNMSYDSKGRISSITDQAKKLVKIEYEERLGKPTVVTRPGLGTIRVSYKSNGEINKVDSKEGPTVAMQVASTFNNLLDVIAPATQEMYL